jgi:hypothetical protein
MSTLDSKKFHVGRNLNKEIPAVGAFEIFVDGKCLFSKVKRKLWPHIGYWSHKIAGVPYDPSKDKDNDGINGKFIHNFFFVNLTHF